jgi:hypothetical protein
LFYEHIYNAVIDKGNWKQLIAKNMRLDTAVSQAFGQTTLAKNYMAWLLDYLQLHPTTTLLTEYDLIKREDSTNNDNKDDDSNKTEDTPDLFCGDLMEVEVSVPTSNGGDWSNTQFKLLVEEGDTKEEYEAMINDCVTASKALRTYIGNQSKMIGSSMKDFDNMHEVIVERRS